MIATSSPGLHSSESRNCGAPAEGVFIPRISIIFHEEGIFTYIYIFLVFSQYGGFVVPM